MLQASIYQGLEFSSKRPVIDTLMDTLFTKEIRIAMELGQEMKAHSAPFPIVVSIIEGAISFGVNDQYLELRRGDIISLESNEVHNLKALNRSVVRLTLSTTDKAQRVKDVVEVEESI